MSAESLWRNRDFVLLQSGQLLSTAGSQSATIAYTLLTLALTHSPAKAGLVTFAQILPSGVFGLLGGVERSDRPASTSFPSFGEHPRLAVVRAAAQYRSRAGAGRTR
jgi:hypothetical protein